MNCAIMEGAAGDFFVMHFSSSCFCSLACLKVNSMKFEALLSSYFLHRLYLRPDEDWFCEVNNIYKPSFPDDIKQEEW